MKNSNTLLSSCLIDATKPLTESVSAGGCGAKVNPMDLQESLPEMFRINDPRLLAGIGDDAAVYEINENQAIVSTVDIIAPIVDDTFLYGRIAAANSLSDIYAMNGRPFMALNVLAADMKMGIDAMKRVMEGGYKACQEAGVFIAGGHTVRNPEFRYGLSALGWVKPNKMTSKTGGKVGDYLVLTKPLGIGVLSQAYKQRKITRQQKEAFIETMVSLNDKAADAMDIVGVNAATDITGFGLAGHLYEMTVGTNLAIEINVHELPVLPGVEGYVFQGIFSGNLPKNKQFLGDKLNTNGLVDPLVDVIFDPQTSGGLLISVSPEKIDQLVYELESRGVLAAIIGKFIEEEKGSINIKY